MVGNGVFKAGVRGRITGAKKSGTYQAGGARIEEAAAIHRFSKMKILKKAQRKSEERSGKQRKR